MHYKGEQWNKYPSVLSWTVEEEQRQQQTYPVCVLFLMPKMLQYCHLPETKQSCHLSVSWNSISFFMSLHSVYLHWRITWSNRWKIIFRDILGKAFRNKSKHNSRWEVWSRREHREDQWAPFGEIGRALEVEVRVFLASRTAGCATSTL